ncbi:hypothetical protein [Actinacidiphila oryziradicis]|uniref:Uncharacterized protein n=1 Tax=Actinacidiphila oryziradicis TaxID=2571141 RepID=A0A4U0SLQ7_9ACTN|nr:hypothetical protein [Actinacidiphila oryziradicis]TKA10183.1 hypothetical protein FCI23_18445 [Actinacidiphila oryziradicis]
MDIANERLRAFVRAHGGRAWSRADLAELDRLRRAFTQAEREVRPVTGPGADAGRRRRARRLAGPSPGG